MAQKEAKTWGENFIVYTSDTCSVRSIRIVPGGYCSKHIHKHRHNLFHVLSGRLQVSIQRENGIVDETVLGPGETTSVPPGELHWFLAIEETTAIEVYYPHPVEDRDIERQSVGGVHG